MGDNSKGRRLKLTAIEQAFAQHLQSQGMKPGTVAKYVGYARRFSKHINGKPIDRVGEAEMRTYFDAHAKARSSRPTVATGDGCTAQREANEADGHRTRGPVRSGGV